MHMKSRFLPLFFIQCACFSLFLSGCIPPGTLRPPMPTPFHHHDPKPQQDSKISVYKTYSIPEISNGEYFSQAHFLNSKFSPAPMDWQAYFSQSKDPESARLAGMYNWSQWGKGLLL